MEFIGSILEILEFIGPSIYKYWKYHQKLDNFVSEFRSSREDLCNRRYTVESGLLKKIRLDQGLNPEVTKWLEDVVEITEDAQRVEERVRKGKYFTRACLGKLVEEKTQKMKSLYDKGNSLQSLAHDDPSSSIVPLPTSELVGEEDVKKKIWSYLEGHQVYKIGVCGMGGIGKTTIMKHIHNELLKKDKFHRIIWVTVSQEFDIGKLQKDIASGLNKKLEEDNNITRRAAKLLAILERQGPFVLILDDVWIEFSLEEVGIPVPTAINGCKLVLTTRSKEVARTMGCEMIDVKPLESNEALKLFRGKVGSDILLETLGLTLKMVVDECDGLPLAIVTVAGSMKGIYDPRLWKNCLNELREHQRTVAGTETDKFGILKLSYDHLKDEKIQHCFLYCTLYPEDHKIQKDEIIEYWLEEGLIEEMQTREAMKCKGHDILKKLEDNCLLEFIEDKSEGECVRMHHLLRGMALQITRKSPRFLGKTGRELPEEHEWKDLLKVSLMFNHLKEIPSSLPSPKCPMLTTLLLSQNKLSIIPESFFDHMLGLKILDLSYNYELHSLPNSISKLVNLTTLLLKACQYLRKVPSLSNLGALKKLGLSRTSIEELPHGIERLTNLKYLDLSQLETSEALPKIPDGILLNLFKLQTLDVDFTIPLTIESGKLLKLENFKCRFSTSHDMGIFFNSQRDCLSWYNIFVGRPMLSYGDKDRIPIGMNFILFFDAQIFGEPNLLPSDVQKLDIRKCNDVRSLNDISGFQDATNLLECSISGCEGMECVLSSWSAPPVTTFSSLKTIKVLFCPKIKNLFSPRLLLGCLHNLEEIRVEDCKELEEIIASEEDGVSELILPKLKRLVLLNLPKLRCICSSTTVPVCDSNEEVAIMYCSDLKYVFGSWFNPLQTLERMNVQGLGSLTSMFDEEALTLLSPAPTTTFFPLVSISIEGCHQLKKLFSAKLLLSCLHNLENIQVQNCEQMKEIVASEEGESDRISKLTLPKLKTLELERLPTLRCICSSTAALVCDSIEGVTIMYCSNLKYVFGSWFNPLQTLERMNVQGLGSLTSVFDEEALALLSPAPTTTFFPLVSISIEGCHQLKKLFSAKLLLSCLHNLETIQVQNCEHMKEIVASEEEESERVSKLTLPKLRTLELERLPTLRCICSSTAILVCDSIEEVIITYCSDLNCVFGSWFNPLQTLKKLYLCELENLKSVLDEEALALLSPAPATTFFPLVNITIATCHQLKKLFSARSLLSCLQNLETIEIVNCKQMEEIISLGSQEEEKVGSQEKEKAPQLSLPKLWKLQLKNLPALKSICGNISVLRCDSLQHLVIIGCTGLKRIPLYLPQRHLKGINAFPKEWWESLEWDHPKAKNALLPFCQFSTEEPGWLRWPRWVAQMPKQKPSVMEAPNLNPNFSFR